MTFVIIFSAGYLVGGAAAGLLIGLTLATRRRNRGDDSARRYSAQKR